MDQVFYDRVICTHLEKNVATFCLQAPGLFLSQLCYHCRSSGCSQISGCVQSRRNVAQRQLAIGLGQLACTCGNQHQNPSIRHILGPVDAVGPGGAYRHRLRATCPIVIRNRLQTFGPGRQVRSPLKHRQSPFIRR